ncbi:MAG: SRPBCC domain-containing protein [bacterium]|nr:SRPBCC domain-containing protein [bacterium]
MAVTKLFENNQRSIIGEYEFDVSPEALWAALTDPNEIEKWFCLHARVEGKVGGEIEFNWDPLFDFKWIDHITVWEDKRRIAFTPRPQDLEANNSPYVCEFVITTDKGKTKLKMVHSGFNHGANWDDEYDSIFGGWTYELFSLWYYMTHHRGSKRDLYWARVNIADLQEKNPFQAITDLQGFFEGKSIRDLKLLRNKFNTAFALSA